MAFSGKGILDHCLGKYAPGTGYYRDCIVVQIPSLIQATQRTDGIL